MDRGTHEMSTLPFLMMTLIILGILFLAIPMD